MAKLGYRFIDHPSDVGIAVEGKTVEELFVNATKGMLSIISEPTTGRKRIYKKLHLKEDSLEEILHSYLSEILWLITTESYFPIKINFSNLNKNTLDATLEGIKLKSDEIKGEVKAVTYHQLKVIHKDGFWTTKVIFDV